MKPAEKLLLSFIILRFYEDTINKWLLGGRDCMPPEKREKNIYAQSTE